MGSNRYAPRYVLTETEGFELSYDNTCGSAFVVMSSIYFMVACHYRVVTEHLSPWPRLWSRKSLATWVFVQQLGQANTHAHSMRLCRATSLCYIRQSSDASSVHANNKENIKVPHYWPFVRRKIDRWPLDSHHRTSDAGIHHAWIWRHRTFCRAQIRGSDHC